MTECPDTQCYLHSPLKYAVVLPSCSIREGEKKRRPSKLVQNRPSVGIYGQTKSVAQIAKPRRNGHSAFCIHPHPSTRLEPSEAGNEHSHGDVVPLPILSASCPWEDSLRTWRRHQKWAWSSDMDSEKAL
jgi:hypothetical protein